MATMMPPCIDIDFGSRDKFLIEFLHKKHGNNWKTISSCIPGSSALQIKIYWLKKQRREAWLKNNLSKQHLPVRGVAATTSKTFVKIICRPAPRGYLDVLADAAELSQ